VSPRFGVAQGDALKFLQNLAARSLPQGYAVDYGGLSRQYIQESSAFIVTFGFALIIIYLALAALFESFRDPAIILVSVPMSIAGALLFISVGVGGASLYIYTEVGLVTLMGLISKHGVEFANELQQQGRSKREAIEQACSIRLRPILMTTAAMVLGVIPLIVASGAGAVSRFSDRQRPIDRNAVYSVCGARRLHDDCRGPLQTHRLGRSARAGLMAAHAAKLI
jgi:multidrug efflux pump